MNFGTIVFGGVSGGFGPTLTLSVNFGTNADRALIVDVLNYGSLAQPITSVVIDPAGANITMTAETETGPSAGVGGTGYLRRFRAAGSTMPTGTKNVVITSTGSTDGVLNARAIPMDGVTAIAAGVSSVASSTSFSVTVPSATGRVVLVSGLGLGIPNARTLAASSPATMLKRVLDTDNWIAQGAIVQSAGAASVPVTITASAATDMALTGWDLTLSAPTGVAPTITTHPSAQTVTAGATATFTAAASGDAPITWQWQRSTDSGSTWSNISGAVSSSYTTPATTVSGGSANNGDRYRAVATNATSPAATSNAATLTVNAAPATGTITITGLKNGSGTSLAGGTLPNVVVLKRSDRSVLLALTAQVINGSGNLVLASTSLPVGTACQVCAFSDDGAQAGSWPATVA